jgi:hypothetical protein
MSAGGGMIAFTWLEAIRRRTIKNMTHTEFLSKYADREQYVNDLVLILCGTRYGEREYFVIKIHGALYEPFAGPHYVQIGNYPAMWVHSLTAFRREFFGLTDKLSFERSVFVCLNDGEIVRLKIARPYLFMHYGVQVLNGDRLKIMKTPRDFFFVGERDIFKHKQELQEKKSKALSTCQAVRTRVRNHLVSSVQQLFCSYMRDHQIDPSVAKQWFHTDISFAIEQCEPLFVNMVRVTDVTTREQIRGQSPRASTVASSCLQTEAVNTLHGCASMIDTSVNQVQRNAVVGAAQSPLETDLYIPDLPVAMNFAGLGAIEATVMAGLHEDIQSRDNVEDFPLL